MSSTSITDCKPAQQPVATDPAKKLRNLKKKLRDIEALEAWHRVYYSIIDKYRQSGRFLGKDQNVMATACIESEMCLLVQGDEESWFKLQDYLIGNLDPSVTYYRLQQIHDD